MANNDCFVWNSAETYTTCYKFVITEEEEKSILESKELVSGVNYKRVDATTTNDSGTVKAQKVSVVEVEKSIDEGAARTRGLDGYAKICAN